MRNFRRRSTNCWARNRKPLTSRYALPEVRQLADSDESHDLEAAQGSLPLIDHRFDDRRETRCAGSRFDPLSFGQPRKTERAEELVPNRGLALRAHGHEGDDLAGLPTEVGEIDLEDAEERGPALLDALVLIVPIVGAREPAVHDANSTRASRLCLDRPLVRDRR